MYKKLITNSVIYGIAPQISRVLSIIILPFITPYLTPIDYGILGIVMSVTAALQVFSTLGMSYILMLYFYKAPNQYKWMWRQVLGFLRIWQIVYVIILSSVLYFFLPLEAKENFYFIILLGSLPFVTFSIYSFAGVNLYRFQQKPLPIATRTIVAGVIVVAVNLLTIRYYRMGYMGWFISLSVSEMLSGLLYYIPLKFKYNLTPIYNFKFKTIKSALKRSMPLLPHYYSIYLLDISDRLVMKILNFPISSIGKYNIVANFGGYFSAFHMAVGQAIGPNIFQSIKSDEHQKALQVTKAYLFVSLVLSLTFSFWCKEIISLLIRNNTLTTYYLWSIGIIMAYNYRPYYVLITQYLSYYEKVRLLPFFTFIPGIINLGLNFLLMPVYGMKVAVYTTFGCYMLMGFMAFAFKRIRDILKLNYYPVLTLAFITVATLLAYLIVEQEYWLKAVANIGMIGFAYLFFVKSKNDKYPVSNLR